MCLSKRADATPGTVRHATCRTAELQHDDTLKPAGKTPPSVRPNVPSNSPTTPSTPDDTLAPHRLQLHTFYAVSAPRHNEPRSLQPTLSLGLSSLAAAVWHTEQYSHLSKCLSNLLSLSFFCLSRATNPSYALNDYCIYSPASYVTVSLTISEN
jgi:hypothetical protein